MRPHLTVSAAVLLSSVVIGASIVAHARISRESVRYSFTANGIRGLSVIWRGDAETGQMVPCVEKDVPAVPTRLAVYCGVNATDDE